MLSLSLMCDKLLQKRVFRGENGMSLVWSKFPREQSLPRYFEALSVVHYQLLIEGGV